MDEILRKYLELLRSVDAWFDSCLEKAGTRISCRPGCSGCCRGLFDITFLDAYLLKTGFEQLRGDLREGVLAKARSRLASLKREWPDFAAPYILNDFPDEEWTEMPEDDETPCPLLSAEGRCLVYDFRPMTCRLHGLPNIDLSGESFSDAWCTLNFPGENPLGREDLRWPFRKTFEEELALFREFTTLLLGHPRNELDTFIPTALLVDFEGTDWRKLESSLGRRMSSTTGISRPDIPGPPIF
jgi:Fe-S-cluster containining protein